MTTEPLKPEEVPLLPCPFCGGEAFVADRNNPFSKGGQHTNGPAWITVSCPTCFFAFCEADAPRELDRIERKRWPFTKWNTRAAEPAVPVAKLRKLLDDNYPDGFAPTLHSQLQQLIDEATK